MMRPIEITLPRLHQRGVDGITLWPFIFYRRGHQHNIALRCHEHYHWRQARRWGVIPWYIAYLALLPFYLGKPADRHPLEAPAYALQRRVLARLQAGGNIDEQLRELGML